MLDPWGNPLLYLHRRDYDTGARFRLRTAAGESDVVVRGQRAPDGT